MSEEDAQQQQIQYEQFTDRHESTMVNEIKELKEAGVDFELNYKVAFTAWLEIRRARGAIMQSVLSPEQLEGEFVKERTERKLNDDEMDRLANLTTLAAVNNGVIFWTRNLDRKNQLIEMQTKILEKMREFTGEVEEPDSYSRFGNAQVMYTFNNFLIPYFKDGAPQTDNLGEHFPLHGPHTFLDGISVEQLRQETEDKRKIVVLAPAASSGVLEAGIFAHYMNTELKIPTTVDPVFFNKYHEEAKVMNRTMPQQETVVIPLDDRILGSGYSPKMAREAAKEKYGSDSLVMSPRMASLR
jgi:hypothetical protein